MRLRTAPAGCNTACGLAVVCCCPSGAKGTAAAAWWQSPRLPGREKDFLSLLGLYKIALLHFPTTRQPTVTGYFPHSNRVSPCYSRCIPGPSGSLRLYLHPPTSASLSTALHHPCSLPPPSVPITAPWPLGQGWGSPTVLTHPSAHENHVLAALLSACCEPGRDTTSGPPLLKNACVASSFISSLGGGEK